MKFSKNLYFSIVLILVGVTVTFAQTDNSQNETPVTTTEESQIQISSGTADTQNSSKKNSDSIDENTLVITKATKTAQKDESSSGIGLFVRMVLVLALVILCIYIVVALLKKGMTPKAQYDPFLRKVSSVPVSSGASVQVVSLLDHAYIIGVTENSVSLISEVTDKELIDAMNLYTDKNQDTKKPKSFSDILDIFMPNGPRDKNSGVFSGTAKTASDLLKKQHERLNNGDNV